MFYPMFFLIAARLRERIQAILNITRNHKDKMGVLVAVFIILQMVLAYVLMVVCYRSLKLPLEKNCMSLVAETLPVVFVLYFDYLAQYFFGIEIKMTSQSKTDNIVAALWIRIFYFICFMSLAKVFTDPTQHPIPESLILDQKAHFLIAAELWVILAPLSLAICVQIYKHRNFLTGLKNKFFAKLTNMKEKSKKETVFDHMNEMTNKDVDLSESNSESQDITIKSEATSKKDKVEPQNEIEAVT